MRIVERYSLMITEFECYKKIWGDLYYITPHYENVRLRKRKKLLSIYNILVENNFIKSRMKKNISRL